MGGWRRVTPLPPQRSNESVWTIESINMILYRYILRNDVRMFLGSPFTLSCETLSFKHDLRMIATVRMKAHFILNQVGKGFFLLKCDGIYKWSTSRESQSAILGTTLVRSILFQSPLTCHQNWSPKWIDPSWHFGLSSSLVFMATFTWGAPAHTQSCYNVRATT